MSTARLSALALLVAAATAAAPPALARDTRFQTPSHKIACLYTTSGGGNLRCDAFFLNDVGFLLDRTHKGKRQHVTDTVGDPHAPVLRYGRSRTLGPFTCASRTTGLKCKSLGSGHGFLISRGRQRVF